MAGLVVGRSMFRVHLSLGRNSLELVLSVFPKRANSFFSVNDSLYGLTDEQKQLRGTIFQFCQKELAPKVTEINKTIKTNEFVDMRQFWLECGKLGILGATAPSQYGGSEMGYLDHCLVMEEMSRVSAGVALSYGAHSNLCLNQIVRNGTEEQKKKHLPELISGEKIGTVAISESNAGSDVVSVKMTAVKNGDHYILNGTKFDITNGTDADTLIVYAKTDPKNPDPQLGITAFIIEKGMPGFSASPKLDKLGIRESNKSELVFDNCIVPEENVMGDIDRGVYVLYSGYDTERCILAAGPVGIMQSCCDFVYEYAYGNKKHCFEDKIDLLEVVQSEFAGMYTILNAGRSYVYTVARALDRGERHPNDCANILQYTTETAMKMAGLQELNQ